MFHYGRIAVSFLFPIGNSKRNGYPNDEHEKRLNQVPEMESMPFVVIELFAQKIYKSIIYIFQGAKKAGTLADEQKHGQSAEKIDRGNASTQS